MITLKITTNKTIREIKSPKLYTRSQVQKMSRHMFGRFGQFYGHKIERVTIIFNLNLAQN